ncbi:uncharacterized protein LOC115767273 [Drosophila novamexicana]|uniref:uncharacterized protein LOC115767273 n=1 Tax=Drosophila novamexicana TaxID=47314 RepID=UPI0011E5DFFE|nr:uncharacterized protein LOC115767273 [Drosophila novamexicana]
MFSAANGKIKLPPHDTDAAASSTLRCRLNIPFRDLHFNVADHRLIPVHDVVFLDDIERNVKPLIYRPVLADTVIVTSTPTPTSTPATTLVTSPLQPAAAAAAEQLAANGSDTIRILNTRYLHFKLIKMPTNEFVVCLINTIRPRGRPANN